MKNTKIPWCHHTHNLVWGCFEISPACDNCYARTYAHRYKHEVWGQGERRTFASKHYLQPFGWNKKAKEAGVIERVFVGSMFDIGEDHPTINPLRDNLCNEIIPKCDSLIFMFLTKRPTPLYRLIPESWRQNDVPKNVWIGATSEDQQHLDSRLRALSKFNADVKFLSAEPQLEHLDLSRAPAVGIKMVISGGESGPLKKIRRTDPAWLQSTVAQCRRMGMAPYVKQLGAIVSRELELKDKKGEDLSELPPCLADLKVREFPQGVSV